MICPNCLEASQHSMCPYCGEVVHLVGFDPLDLVDPLGLYRKGYAAVSSDSSPSDATSSSDGPSLWDRLPSPSDILHANPAYQAGKYLSDAGGGALSSVRSPFAAITDTLSSLGTVVKWILIGGAVVGAVVLLYGVFKFVPVALGLAASNAREVGKMAPQLIAKAI